jgi:hypothetical protein
MRAGVDPEHPCFGYFFVGDSVGELDGQLRFAAAVSFFPAWPPTTRTQYRPGPPEPPDQPVRNIAGKSWSRMSPRSMKSRSREKGMVVKGAGGVSARSADATLARPGWHDSTDLPGGRWISTLLYLALPCSIFSIHTAGPEDVSLGDRPQVLHTCCPYLPGPKELDGNCGVIWAMLIL